MTCSRIRPPSTEKIDRVIDLVREAGGLEYAQHRACLRRAANRSWPLPDDPAVEILRLTVEFVVERQK